MCNQHGGFRLRNGICQAVFHDNIHGIEQFTVFFHHKAEVFPPAFGDGIVISGAVAVGNLLRKFLYIALFLQSVQHRIEEGHFIGTVAAFLQLLRKIIDIHWFFIQQQKRHHRAGSSFEGIFESAAAVFVGNTSHYFHPFIKVADHDTMCNVHWYMVVLSGLIIY